jgi:hypothetical protein
MRKIDQLDIMMVIALAAFILGVLLNFDLIKRYSIKEGRWLYKSEW